MGKQKNRYTFEIELNIKGQIIRDIVSCYFFRVSLIKNASYCIIEGLMPWLLINDMFSSTSGGKHEDVKLTVFHSDELDKNIETRKRIKVYEMSLKCLNINKPPLGDNPKVYAKMVLIHPVFQSLNNNNKYNRILNEITAMDAIKNYEDFLKSTFGDIFNFNKINSEVNKSTYKYEHILTKSSCDLLIPEYIINNYKPTNNFCFYFFDNFNMSAEKNKEKNSKDITCWYINPYEKKGFVNIDCEKFIEKNMFTTKIKDIPFTDIDHKLDNPDGLITVRGKEVEMSHEKVEQTTHQFHTRNHNSDSDNSDEEEENSQNIKNIMDAKKSEIKTKGSTNYSRLYSPDSADLAKERFNQSATLLNAKIKNLSEFETKNSFIDFPQFGRIYNLDPDFRSKYNYTPISIVNIFYRQNKAEEFLYHSSKSIMICFN